MTPRPSHLPNHYERSALTKLASGRELQVSKLFQRAVTRSLSCWRKAGSNERAQLYRITEGGKAALRAKV